MIDELIGLVFPDIPLDILSAIEELGLTSADLERRALADLALHEREKPSLALAKYQAELTDPEVIADSTFWPAEYERQIRNAREGCAMLRAH